MEPTYKAPAINKFINKTFGIDRVKAIKGDVCAICGGPAKDFRDAVSRKEYTISRLCQTCQNKVFDID